MALYPFDQQDLNAYGNALKERRLSQYEKTFFNYLGNVSSRNDIKKAIRILLRYDPEFKALLKKNRAEQQHKWKQLPKEKQTKIIEERVLVAKEKKKATQDKLKAKKNKIKQRLEANIKKLKTKNFTVMFTHYNLQEDENLNRRLIMTSCIILDSNDTAVSRGLALVSVLDNGSKLEGRLISLERAIKAINEERSSLIIDTYSAKYIVDCVERNLVSSGKTVYRYKAEYKPIEFSFIESERIEQRLKRRFKNNENRKAS